MEFNDKLQRLRKQNNMTQEKLAEQLYVSRTAISKWESGGGYPSIDSLKTIADYFHITIDELLSSNELIIAAEEDNKLKVQHMRDLVYGLLDLSVVMFLFLPIFGQHVGEVIEEVSLLRLTEMEWYMKACYISSIQPYAALFTFLFVLIKGVLLIKRS